MSDYKNCEVGVLECCNLLDSTLRIFEANKLESRAAKKVF